MLLRLEFHITYNDGESKTVRTSPATDMAFERRFGSSLMALFASAPFDRTDDTKAVLDWFTSTMKAEHTYFLAWHASRDGGDFDTWLDGIDAIDWKLASSVDPTQPAPAN